MRSLDKEIRNQKVGMKIAITIFINIILIYLLVISMNNQISPSTITDASIIAQEEINPEDYPELSLSNIEEAINCANNLLSEMTYGNVQEIDEEDNYFHGKLLRNYELGDIIYWKLGDRNIEIFIRADTCEIIHYRNANWINGSYSQGAIETLGIQIVSQFTTFPENYNGPSTEFDDTAPISIYNNTTGITSEYHYYRWLMKYNRTYNDIPTEDNIELWLNPNSDLSYYHKNWNMDLDEFSTSYSLTKTEAEDIALALAGEGSVIDESFLIIIRPNYFWTIGGFMYGAAPALAWEIRIIDDNNLLKVYHIDANTEEIIGGDSALA